MATLQTQCKEFAIVINLPKDMTMLDFNTRLIALNEKLTQGGYFYASLVHDKDVDVNGKAKVVHWHYVIWSQKRCRIETMLYRLLNYLNLEPFYANCISIDKCNDLSFAIQYLTHKNHKEKFQYNVNYIISNLDNKKLFDYYNATTQEQEITTQMLYKWVVIDCKSNIELMFMLGISRYVYYSKAIAEIRSISHNKNFRVYADNIAKMYDDGLVSSDIDD